MEFGKIHDISNIDFTLPPDDPENVGRFTANQLFQLYFGSPAFAVKNFEGKIYPPKISPSEYLKHYAKNFNSIELNTTHYRIPDKNTTDQWKSKVTKNFKFCPKLHKDISHSKMGLIDKERLLHWFSFLNNLEQNLGPCFIQFHEMFSYEDRRLFFQFLKNWSSEFKLCIELRHPSWYENAKVLPKLTEYLFQQNIGLIITDVAGRRDILHSTLSAPYSMIRLIGNNLDITDEKRLNLWANRILDWKKIGLQELFLFLHQPDDLFTIEFSKIAEKTFLAHNFDHVPHFELVQEQIELF